MKILFEESDVKTSIFMTPKELVQFYNFIIVRNEVLRKISTPFQKVQKIRICSLIPCLNQEINVII